MTNNKKQKSCFGNPRESAQNRGELILDSSCSWTSVSERSCLRLLSRVGIEIRWGWEVTIMVTMATPQLFINTKTLELENKLVHEWLRYSQMCGPCPPIRQYPLSSLDLRLSFCNDEQFSGMYKQNLITSIKHLKHTPRTWMPSWQNAPLWRVHN